MIKIASVDKIEGHEISQVRGLQTALNLKQATGNYSTLVDGIIPSSQLPSYVDEILEYSNFENFPTTGQNGKIYLAIGTRKRYRWSGSMYIEIPISAVDSVAGKVGFVTLVIPDVTGLQSALDAKQVAGNYANATHSHEISGITGLQSALDAKQVTGNYANATHTHAISGVTGLQSALDSKQVTGNYANATHSHEISGVTGLQSALDAKQVTGNYANATHGHAISSVTGLQSALDGKQVLGNYANATHSHAISDVTALQSALNSKQITGNYANATHSHAISDVTGLQSALDGKQVSGNYADATHSHAISGVNGLQSALDGKQVSGNYANTTHGHAISDVTGLQSELDSKQAAGNYSRVGHKHNVSDITGINLDLDLCNFSGAMAVQNGDCDCDMSLAIDTRVSNHLVELFNSFDPCAAANPSTPAVYTGDLCDHPGLDRSYNGMRSYNQKLIAAFDCPSYDPNNPSNQACQYSIKLENRINAYIAASVSQGVANCVSDQTKLATLRGSISGYVKGFVPTPCDILKLVPAEIQVNGPANVCGFNLCALINDIINNTTVSQSCIDFCAVLDKIVASNCSDDSITSLFHKFIDENGNAKTTAIADAIIEFVGKNDKDLFAKIIEPNGDTKTQIKDSIIEFIDKNKNDIVYKIIDENGVVTQQIKDRLEKYVKQNRDGIFNQIISATGETSTPIKDSIVEFVDDNQDRILTPIFATSLTNLNPPLYQKIESKKDDIFTKFIDQAGTTSTWISNAIKAFVGANGRSLLRHIFFGSDTSNIINMASVGVLGEVLERYVIPYLRTTVLFTDTIAIVPNLNSINPSNAQTIATAAKLLIAETGIKILDSFQFKGEYGAEGLKFSNPANDYEGEMGSTGLRVKYQAKKLEIAHDALAITNSDGNVSIVPGVLHMTGSGGGGGEIIMDVSALQGKTARFRPLRICTGGQTETVYVLMATSSSN
jgi:hypothetical protein